MEKPNLGIVLKTLVVSAVGLGALLGVWQLAAALTWSDVTRVIWSLLVIAPLVALLSGVGAALWGLSLWPALTSSLLALVVGVTLRFTEDSLVYIPVYLGLTAAGFVLGRVLHRRRSAQQDED